MAFEPLLDSLSDEYVLPTSQSFANAAIIAVFAFLVPLLTMEINFFRLAAYRAWRKCNRLTRPVRQVSAMMAEVTRRMRPGDAMVTEQAYSDGDAVKTGDTSSRDTTSRGQLINNEECNDHAPKLQRAYKTIRLASLEAIASSLLVYAMTAVGIALNTRGMEEKVIAIIIGASKCLAAFLVFIVSTMIPQWVSSKDCDIFCRINMWYSEYFRMLFIFTHSHTSLYFQHKCKSIQQISYFRSISLEFTTKELSALSKFQATFPTT